MEKGKKSVKKTTGETIDFNVEKTLHLPKSKIYKPKKIGGTSIRVNKSVEGQRIETKIENLFLNKGKVKDSEKSQHGLIFQERGAGINAAYDIRTDRWETAVMAGDKIAKSYAARREENPKMEVVKDDKEKGDGKPESTHGKADNGTE